MMIINNIFDAVREGSLEDFKKIYTGNINEIDKGLDINLLCMAMTNDKRELEKYKIIEFLINEGININYVTRKYKRNALHMLYFCNFRPNINFVVKVTELLLDNGIQINKLDIFNAIPLKYAITINKFSTDENRPLYLTLLHKGSDYNLKDIFGKSCLDYANEYSWRNGFLNIVKEFENENK